MPLTQNLYQLLSLLCWLTNLPELHLMNYTTRVNYLISMCTPPLLALQFKPSLPAQWCVSSIFFYLVWYIICTVNHKLLHVVHLICMYLFPMDQSLQSLTFMAFQFLLMIWNIIKLISYWPDRKLIKHFLVHRLRLSSTNYLSTHIHKARLRRWKKATRPPCVDG